MKKYIILSGSVDGETCEEEGFVNCASFDLADPRAFDDLEDAIIVRNQIVEDDLANAYETWGADEEAADISINSGSFGKTSESDKYLDIIRRSEIVNETIYKIKEIECECSKGGE